MLDLRDQRCPECGELAYTIGVPEIVATLEIDVYDDADVAVECEAGHQWLTRMVEG